MCDIFVNARMPYSDDVETGDVDRRSKQRQPLAVPTQQPCGHKGDQIVDLQQRRDLVGGSVVRRERGGDQPANLLAKGYVGLCNPRIDAPLSI